MSYATPEQLAAWMTGGDYPVPTGTAATRLLQRASELVADNTRGMIPADLADTTSIPEIDAYGTVPDPLDPDVLVVDPTTPATVLDALRDATCAQVEQWCDVGESNAIAGYSRNTSMTSIGVSRLPDVLAPRAVMLLRAEGIYNPAPPPGVGAAITVEAV